MKHLLQMAPVEQRMEEHSIDKDEEKWIECWWNIVLQADPSHNHVFLKLTNRHK